MDIDWRDTLLNKWRIIIDRIVLNSWSTLSEKTSKLLINLNCPSANGAAIEGVRRWEDFTLDAAAAAAVDLLGFSPTAISRVDRGLTEWKISSQLQAAMWRKMPCWCQRSKVRLGRMLEHYGKETVRRWLQPSNCKHATEPWSSVCMCLCIRQHTHTDVCTLSVQ